MSKNKDRKDLRVFIVDDHSVVRHGIAALLSGESGMCVAGEAAGYEEALAWLRTHTADVLIADLTLKDRTGLDLIRECQRLYPQMKIVVLSMHDESTHAEKSIRAGALGYVMKESADEKLAEAIQSVAAGEVYVNPAIAARLLKQISETPGTAPAYGVEALTEREREIFGMIGRGLSSRKIAEELGLSERTVEVHRGNIKRKMRCADAAQVVREAVRWVESEH